jgi:ATP-dependent helicase/DNAse subunit B
MFGYFVKYYYNGLGRDDTTALDIGTTVHECFEYIGKHQTDVVDRDSHKPIVDVNDLVLEIFQTTEYFTKNKLDVKDLPNNHIYCECNTIVNRYLDSKDCVLYDEIYIKDGQPVVEQEFKLKIEGCGLNQPLEITGFMDIALKVNSDTLIINDYKSSKSVMQYDDIINNIQLKMYFVAAKHIFPEIKHFIMRLDYCKLGKNRIVTFDRDYPLEVELFGISNSIKRQTVSNIYREPGWYCDRMCIGREHCYQLWNSLKKSGLMRDELYGRGTTV